MPEVDYVDGVASRSVFNFDRFQLNKDEIARIAILESKVVTEFAHYVQPDIHKGYYICLGDFNTLLTEGEEREKCPFCAKASRGGDIGTATQYFCTLILQYITNSKGQALKPINGIVKYWKFNAKKFTALKQIKDEFGELKKYDLLVGPCSSESFQNYDIRPGKDSLWSINPEDAKRISDYYKEERMGTKELVRLIGKNVDYDIASGIVADLTGGSRTASSEDVYGVEDVVGDDTVAESSSGEVDVDALLDGL